MTISMDVIIIQAFFIQTYQSSERQQRRGTAEVIHLKWPDSKMERIKFSISPWGNPKWGNCTIDSASCIRSVLSKSRAVRSRGTMTTYTALLNNWTLICLNFWCLPTDRGGLEDAHTMFRGIIWRTWAAFHGQWVFRNNNVYVHQRQNFAIDIDRV